MTAKKPQTKRKTTKKPLTLEQEAELFVKDKNTTPLPELPLSSLRQMLASSILSGLLARGGNNRAQELVDEAYRYADLVLQHNKQQ